MPADNSIYNTHSAGWWDENNFLYLLKTGVNSIRFEFFQNLLVQNGNQPASLKVLDIGSGGGFLSEEFANLGCRVTGLDLSHASLAAAHIHARVETLAINYLLGDACVLPFANSSFDIVLCCDVLEHLDNFVLAVKEASRLLKPGGYFLFDTINRTLQSYLETILVGQELPITRFFAPHSHDWKQFITPNELTSACVENNLTVNQISGFQPSISKFQTLREIIRLKRGRTNFAEFGRRLKFKQCASLSGSYLGWATKF